MRINNVELINRKKTCAERLDINSGVKVLRKKINLYYLTSIVN